MEYYISIDTIRQAYNELSRLEYSNQSILHIFFILKGIGINNLDYSDVDIIKRRGVPYAQDLGGLFSDVERQPDKCDFINPFMMSAWGTNPTEKLKKWVESRVKNNVIGGATTWRKIVMQDKEGDFKFVYDYVEQIKDVTMKNKPKIPLQAMAVWCNRFTVFDERISVSRLCNSFLDRFHFDSMEKNEFFTLESRINRILFSNNLHDTQTVRQLIGAPSNLPGWEISRPVTGRIELSNIILRRYDMSAMNRVEKSLLKRILDDYRQLILSGPPGTSKSYLCNQLAGDYDKCVHVQFHPQYSYQQFVGGYVVDKTDVKYHKGVMLDLIDEASSPENSSKKYLVIIDEINRANTSQVFGDLIQCLDRSAQVNILCDGELVPYSIPKNIHIIGTMNTTDRSIGALDYALKRRFLDVYCGSDSELLMDLCPGENFISLAEFLEKLNSRLYENLKNREMCVGHAIFLNDEYKNNEGKYEWNYCRFEILFNYKILPLVEEYCYGNYEIVYEIIGGRLAQRLSGDEFVKALQEFMQS